MDGKIEMVFGLLGPLSTEWCRWADGELLAIASTIRKPMSE